MASRTATYVTLNDANVCQAGQGFPGTAGIQQPAMVQYVVYGGQQLGSPSNPPEQNPRLGPLEKLRKVETKTLGAIQIMIGLIHIGLGVVCFINFIGSSVLWSGIFFIASGSLSVSAEKRLTRGLVQCSVGMNITSAIISLSSIMLCIINLSVTHSEYNNAFSRSIGTGLSVLLLLFSLLEFCITVSTAHFGCQATCCNSEPEAVVYVPCTVSGGEMMLPDSCPTAPPAYEATEPSSKGD